MKEQEKKEATNFYVNGGYSIETILRIMGGKVSRKTLYNWKDSEHWDEQRKAQFSETKLMLTNLVELAKLAINEALADPSLFRISAVSKMIGLLKSMSQNPIDNIVDPKTGEPVKSEAQKNVKKVVTPELIEELERKLLGC